MPAQLRIQIWIRNSKVKYKLSKTEVLDTVSSYIKEVTLEWKPLKKLSASRFLKGLISTFVLTLLRFFRKLFLWSKSSKYEIFCFKTKIFFKKHVFWSKIFVVSNTNSFEQFPTDLKVTSSLNNFKHKLKIYFLRNSKIWNKMSLLIDTVLGTATLIFLINFN